MMNRNSSGNTLKITRLQSILSKSIILERKKNIYELDASEIQNTQIPILLQL